MKILAILKQSFRAIFANKGRSFLTVLGIIIGIGSVIALVSLGNGVKASVDTQIKQLGTTTLTITPGTPRFTQPGSGGQGQGGGFGGGQGARQGAIGTVSSLTVNDLNTLSNPKTQPNVKYVTGTVSGTTIIPTVNGDLRATVSGTSPSFFQINSVGAAGGKLFTQADIDAKTNVAVLGDQTASDAFGTQNPIGKEITISSTNYQVIGVLAHKDESGFQNLNDAIYVPYSSLMVTLNTGNFNSMRAEATSDSTVDAAKTDITNTLLKNHNISDPKLADFSVLTAKDLLSAVSSITGVLTSLLGGIAAISLVVGGIGIMNIMLVSVTERTREIGLRKAVGAQTSDILLQFMIEAVLLTVAGGILGIGLGFLASKILTRFVGFTPVVTTNSILLAVGVSAVVGIVFGIYPAIKASLLNPIDALRYE